MAMNDRTKSVKHRATKPDDDRWERQVAEEMAEAAGRVDRTPQPDPQYSWSYFWLQQIDPLPDRRKHPRTPPSTETQPGPKKRLPPLHPPL